MFKKLCTVIFVCISLCCSNVFAERVEIKPLDVPYDSTSSSGDSRFDALDNEVRALHQRIETLESVIRSMQIQMANVTGHVNVAKADDGMDPGMVPRADQDSNGVAAAVGGGAAAGVVEVVTPAMKKPENPEEKRAYNEALSDFKDGNYGIAREKWGIFVKQYPQGVMLSDAYFWYAESCVKSDDNAEAALYYMKSYTTNKANPKAAEALLKSASAMHAMKKNSEACTVLAQLRSAFPKLSGEQGQKVKELQKTCKCN